MQKLLMKTLRYFFGSQNRKGVLRSHSRAVAVGVIDSRIRELVSAFNRDGVVASVSSCEGHRVGWLRTRETPFVMFASDITFATRLASRIRLDQIDHPMLNHYWLVDATFNVDDQLIFCLRCPDSRFRRKRLDADFAQLKLWVDEIVRTPTNFAGSGHPSAGICWTSGLPASCPAIGDE